jgi:uncharacterized membrane protein
MRSRWFGPIAVVALFVFGVLALPHLTAQVPSHWDVHGQVNGTLPRLTAVLLGPAITLIVWLVALALPRIDPRGRGYVAFGGTYWLIMNAITAFLALTFALTIGVGLGWNVNPARLIPAGVGLLFVLLGNELGRVRPNWFVGIRTPWTLSDEYVWRETHRAGGRAFVAVGALMVLCSLVAPMALMLAIILAGALGLSIGLIAYSYLLYRRQHPSAGRLSQ